MDIKKYSGLTAATKNETTWKWVSQYTNVETAAAGSMTVSFDI